MRNILLLFVSSLALVACDTISNPDAAFQGATPGDYRVRHPLMVSTQRAYVPHQCGQWPQDVGAMSLENKLNSPHYNHGCATQQNLGAMVSNPNDLVQARAMGPGDARRRAVVMEKWRSGQDPSSTSKVDDKNKTSGK